MSKYNLNMLSAEGQDLDTVDKLCKKILGILSSDEVIEYMAIQKKLVVTISPDAWTLTNKRVIISRQKNLGMSTDFESHEFSAIQELKSKEGLMNANLIMLSKSLEYKLEDVPKSQAKKFAAMTTNYLSNHAHQTNIIQSETEVATTVNAHNDSPTPEDDKLTQTLQKLKALYDQGLITQTEFETKKNELLSNL
ncbi:MAG: PH domain-containing protein [Chitinophagales bacterium]|jgi:hypothetical protein|nr:PH domain-containing protein [Chitinophagales bacterium]